jgi:hypothetical protein
MVHSRGWLVDTICMTILLPAHRIDLLHELLATIPTTRKCIALSA